jgi:hypothetical protein
MVSPEFRSEGQSLAGTLTENSWARLRTVGSFFGCLGQNAFHCFKRGRPGNALDLWAHATGQTVCDAAVELCRRLNLPLPELAAQRSPLTHRHRAEEPVDPAPRSCTIT